MALFEGAKELVDSGKNLAVSPAGQYLTNGQFTGPNFAVYGGLGFAFMTEPQATYVIHEFTHIAAGADKIANQILDLKVPRQPGSTATLTGNIYTINRDCGTALPDGY